MLDRNVGGSPKEIIQGNYVPMDIRVWDPKRQPYKWTPCEQNNGRCSHLCLLAPYPPGYTCACPTGIKLIDNHTCANGNILIYTTRLSIQVEFMKQAVSEMFPSLVIDNNVHDYFQQIVFFQCYYWNLTHQLSLLFLSKTFLVDMKSSFHL